MDFQDLQLSSALLKAVAEMGFEETTKIQERAIPMALQGKDIIGQAQTGTGKTAAFGIPMVEKLDRNQESVQALVVTPTRELAVQVAEELNRIGQFKGINALPIYGGQDIERQIRSLKKRPQIIVATPGRLMDHMRRHTVRLQNVKTVVLDEADEMLDMGFVEDIETILKEVPEERQTMLFSATMSPQIKMLAYKYMKDPESVMPTRSEMTVPLTEQYYLEVSERIKFDIMCRLLDMHSPDLAIIFGRTKRRVDELNEALHKRGYMSEGIHGDLTQAKRDSVMRQFRDGSIDILVATDVAARGLDITGVTHVYNFDIPQDPEGYVHRIGRTGRAGKPGQAYTLVTPRELSHLRAIEQVTKKKIIRKPIPTTGEAMEGQQRITAEKLLQTVESGGYQNYRGIAEELLEEHDSMTLVCAALKLLTKEPDNTPVHLTEENPLRSKRGPSQAPPGRRPRNTRKR